MIPSFKLLQVFFPSDIRYQINKNISENSKHLNFEKVLVDRFELGKFPSGAERSK